MPFDDGDEDETGEEEEEEDENEDAGHLPPPRGVPVQALASAAHSLTRTSSKPL